MDKKTKRKPTGAAAMGAGPGRPKGVPNKTTAALKDMILQALSDAGGVDYLKTQSELNPAAFMTLIGKVLPLTVAGDSTSPLRLEIGLPWLKQQIQARNSE